jgi:hypothetical protein
MGIEPGTTRSVVDTDYAKVSRPKEHASPLFYCFK